MTTPNAARCTTVDYSIRLMRVDPELIGWHLVTDLTAPTSTQILTCDPVIGGWEVKCDDRREPRYFSRTQKLPVSEGPVSPAFRRDGLDTGAIDLRSARP